MCPKPKQADKPTPTTDKIASSQSVVSGDNYTPSKHLPLSRSNLIIVIGIAGLIVIAVIAGLHYQHKQHDKAVNTRFTNFVSNETSCKKFLNQFGNDTLSDPKNSAHLLEVQEGCAKSEGKYNQALAYLDKLEKVYNDNPKIYRYTNIDEARVAIKQLKSNPPEPVVNMPKRKTGPQPDGSYYGP